MYEKYDIAIIGEMPACGYSGGRYHAWIMAEALAEQGNHIYMITNNVPEFSKDFEQYPSHQKIQIVIVNDFWDFKFGKSELDYVICIPAIGKDRRFYYACLDFAMRKKARFAFVNFETPNWYNLYAKMERSEKDYVILQGLCKYGCLVFSSAKESQKYAKIFYSRYPKKTEHCVWSPPINSVVADSVEEEKQNQILIFLRIKDKHKGGEDFLSILGEYLRGMTCVCIVGMGEIDPDFLKEATEKAEKYGIKLRFEKSLSDWRKFQEMKRSKLLLFPSHFEGYGYPPVEALYCGTKCVVYDLPVLREISGNALTYCENNNITMMRELAEKILKEDEHEPICVDTADFKKQAERLQEILDKNFGNEAIRAKGFLFEITRDLRKHFYRKKNPMITGTIRYCIDHDVVISNKLDCKKEKWGIIKKRLDGKQIYIWGSGRLWRELYGKYIKRLEIKGVIDKDIRKIGMIDAVSKNLVIQSPDELKKADRNNVVVFISNKDYVDEIIEELQNFGIEEYHSLCMIELNEFCSRIYRSWKKFGHKNIFK